MTGLTGRGTSVLPRSVSRDPSPLKWRRVRHIESGREGYIDYTRINQHSIFGGQPVPDSADVVWDDAPRPNGWARPERVEFTELEFTEPTPITAPVRVRKVLYRGHKAQVAERWATFADVPEGCERFIEFDPQPMAYRRWRIVQIGVPLDAETVAETPDQHPRSEHLRRVAKENVDYGEPDGYGY